MGAPGRQGLYDPRNEHDACGVGFVANIKGRKSHEVVSAGLEILINLDHRGAVKDLQAQVKKVKKRRQSVAADL